MSSFASEPMDVTLSSADDSKVMVKLVSLLPEFEVPSDDIAVPSNIRRPGLSKVVNYLLGNIDEGDSEEDDNDNEKREEKKMPAFDFMVKNKVRGKRIAMTIVIASNAL